jgi:hypothetical protein
MNSKRRIVIIISMAGALSLGALQLVPATRRINPPVNPGQSLQGTLTVPTPVDGILRRACMDCHSNETRWPWYSRVAPISWGVEKDVMRARKAMNLSEWTIGPGRRPGKAIGYFQAMCSGVTEGRMPPRKYTLLHKESRLSAADRQTLCEWTASETDRYTQKIRQPSISRLSQ